MDLFPIGSGLRGKRVTPERSSTLPASRKRTPLQELPSPNHLPVAWKREKLRSVSFSVQSESRTFRWQSPSTALGTAEVEHTKTKTPQSRKALFLLHNQTKSLQELVDEDDASFSFIDSPAPPPPVAVVAKKEVLEERRPLAEVLRALVEEEEEEEGSSEDTVVVAEEDDNASTCTEVVEEEEEDDEGCLTDLVETSSSSSSTLSLDDGYQTELVGTDEEEEYETEEIQVDRPLLASRTTVFSPPATPLKHCISPPSTPVVVLPPIVRIKEPTLQQMEDDLVNSLPANLVSLRDIVHFVLGAVFPSNIQLDPIGATDTLGKEEEEAPVAQDDLFEYVQDTPPSQIPSPPTVVAVARRPRRKRKDLLRADPVCIVAQTISPGKPSPLKFIHTVATRQQPPVNKFHHRL
ncbi:hypothetical protein BASA81_007832 [Batrachochytrium salamandrivorans]|nr:hypothetical protein BASA81_007832 [Batrachochytrium salamandrivorans]